MAIIEKTRKRDGVKSYYIDFRDQKGRRVREVAGTTRTQAKDLLKRRLGEVRSGTYVNPRDIAKEEDLGPTFVEFAQRFLKDYARLRRSNHYETTLNPAKTFFGEKLLRSITRADLDLYAAERARATGKQGKPIGSSTRRKNLMSLGTLLKMAVRWGVLEHNPAFDLQKPAEPTGMDRFLSLEEWRKVERASAPWLRPILTMAVATGMRRKEVLNLKWQDVDLKASLLYVSEDNKTGKPRVIPINETVRRLLSDRDKLRDLRTGERLFEFVFTKDNGKPYNGKQARDFIGKKTVKVMKAAGLKDASFKTLRDTAGSWMVQQGASLYEVQKILGHTTPAMTQKYAHLQPGHLKSAMASIDSALSGVDTQMDTRQNDAVSAQKPVAATPSSPVASVRRARSSAG